MIAFSLVLPCYNEASSLESLSRRAVASARRRGMGPSAFQLVLVDNGSTDNSAQVLDKIVTGPDGAWIDIVRVKKNRGYGAGLWEGLRTTESVIVGYTHADEQCDPEDAFLAYEMIRLDGGRQLLVKGNRRNRATSDWIVSRGFEGLASLILWTRLHEINAQPKVFHADLLNRLSDPPADFSFDLYVLVTALKAGWRRLELDVDFPPRRHGMSNWSATLRSRSATISRMVSTMIEWRIKDLSQRFNR